MKIKDRLHRSYSIISLTVLLITGAIILLSTQNRITSKLYNELTQTNLIIYKMVENVFQINRGILLRNLDIFDQHIGEVSLQKNEILDSDAEHHITQLTDYISIETLSIDGIPAFENFDIVDDVAALTGGNISLLQIVPQGLLRISTNIERTDGSRATQIYYPNDHMITRAMRSGEIYVDKIFESGHWQLVAFKPIIVNGNTLGAIQVGIQPDVEALREQILDIKIGETGIPFIVDTEGILIIASEEENENVYHLPHIKKMISDKSDGVVYHQEEKNRVITAYQYLPEMEWIVASGSYLNEFYGELQVILWIISLSIITALLIIVLVSSKLAENLARPIKQLTGLMEELKGTGYEQLRFKIRKIKGEEEEIQVLTNTFDKMLYDLDDAQKQIISRHRRFRETSLRREVDDLLTKEFSVLETGELEGYHPDGMDAAGDYYDIAIGPGNLKWYLIGLTGEVSYAAGLFMMIAQSFLNSLFKEMPQVDQYEAVQMLNGYLAPSVNDILGRNTAFSIALLVDRGDGYMTYSGPDRKIFIHSPGHMRKRSVEMRPVEYQNGEIFRAEFRLEEEELMLLRGKILPSDSLQIQEEHLNSNEYLSIIKERREESDSLFILKTV